jgi:mannose-6-phosphate isomerase-like protein (cupin superfamily)
MKMDKVSLNTKFGAITEHWAPKIVGELNGQQVKLAKLKGAFVWHHHEEEDELFYVVRGTLLMAFQDQTVTIREGEFLIVPKGIEHKPIAEEEVHVMLFEPASTVNTGNVSHALTRNGNDRI